GRAEDRHVDLHPVDDAGDAMKDDQVGEPGADRHELVRVAELGPAGARDRHRRRYGPAAGGGVCVPEDSIATPEMIDQIHAPSIIGPPRRIPISVRLSESPTRNSTNCATPTPLFLP